MQTPKPNDTKQTGIVVSEKVHWRPKLPDKKWLVAVGVIIVLVGVGGALLLYYHATHNKSGTKGATAQCSSTVLTQAAPLLNDAANTTALQAVVKQIQANSKYTSDVNCLYVVTVYYVNISDTKNAQVNYEKLVKIYNPKVGYDKTISGVATAPSVLKSRIDFLVQEDPTSHGSGVYTYGVPLQ